MHICIHMDIILVFNLGQDEECLQPALSIIPLNITQQLSHRTQPFAQMRYKTNNFTTTEEFLKFRQDIRH